MLSTSFILNNFFLLQEHSTLNEDEFYDAVESSNDHSVEEAKQIKDQLLQCTKNNVQTTQTNWGELIRAAATNASLKHSFWPEVILKSNFDIIYYI